MKNLIICLLFSCFFLVSNSIIANNSGLDGVTIVTVVNTKTGQTACSFELTKDYQSKDNSIEITVVQGKGIVVYSVVTNDLNITLPPSLSGTLLVTLKIGDFVSTQEITL